MAVPYHYLVHVLFSTVLYSRWIEWWNHVTVWAIRIDTFSILTGAVVPCAPCNHSILLLLFIYFSFMCSDDDDDNRKRLSGSCAMSIECNFVCLFTRAIYIILYIWIEYPIFLLRKYVRSIVCSVWRWLRKIEDDFVLSISSIVACSRPPIHCRKR